MSPCLRPTSRLSGRGHGVQIDCFYIGRLSGTPGDNASDFSSQEFNSILAGLDAQHIYIRAGRTTASRCVERVEQTLIEECWKPVLTRYLTPNHTGLRRARECEAHAYTIDCAHQRRRIQGQTPEQALMDSTLST